MESSDRRWSALISLLLAVMVGLLAFAASAVLAEKLKPTRLVVLPAALVGSLVVVQLGMIRETVLFLWVVSITYFRYYYIYSVKGEPQGLYWIPSDIALAMLVLVWVMDAFGRRRLVPTRIGWTWLAIIPWLTVHLIEIFAAPRPDWVMWETVKQLRSLLILVLIPSYCLPRDWWICIAGIGAGVIGQSMVGVMQVALRRSAFILEGETAVRAAGTMMHPNLLAAYFLVCIPVFFALGLGASRPWVRWPSLLAGLAGLGGLVATQSRTPIVLFAGQLVIIGIFLFARGRIKPNWLIGAGSILLLLAVAAATPFADKIMKRITGNWRESVEFRTGLNHKAFELFEKNQLLGIGPCHFTQKMIRFKNTYAKLYRENVEKAKETNVRYIFSVHNSYLLALSEGGVLGFSGLIFLQVFGLVTGIRAILSTTGEVQIACVGMTAGLLGIYGQGMTEYALLMDQGLMPTVLVIALMGCAPTLFADRPPAESAC
jgi:hypothetical protein